MEEIKKITINQEQKNICINFDDEEIDQEQELKTQNLENVITGINNNE